MYSNIFNALILLHEIENYDAMRNKKTFSFSVMRHTKKQYEIHFRLFIIVLLVTQTIRSLGFSFNYCKAQKDYSQTPQIAMHANKCLPQEKKCFYDT